MESLIRMTSGAYDSPFVQLLYTVEIVIMHRMIMHKSHIAWVFLGTKLSKHGIVP